MKNIRYSGIAVSLLSIVACTDIIDNGEAEHAASLAELSSTVPDSSSAPAQLVHDEDSDTAQVDMAAPETNASSPTCAFVFEKWLCQNRAPALLFTTRSQSSHALDTMRSTLSIFRCKKDGGFSGGGVHPNRWACTQGDDQKKFGWMRDIDIVSETDPLPTCPTTKCP